MEREGQLGNEVGSGEREAVLRQTLLGRNTTFYSFEET
jgi:hypothetical protein